MVLCGCNMTKAFCRSLLAIALFSSALDARLQPAPNVVAFTHVAVVNPGGTATQRDTTVVVTGERITDVGRTGDVRIPPGARVIDATGKYLIPGLWDMHAHIFTHRGGAFFALYAVAGVTAVRDMNTFVPMAQIDEHRKRIAAGMLIGPRLIAVAGPLSVGGVIQNLRRRSGARFDERTAQPLFAKFRANDNWLVPTLVQGLAWQYLADGTVPYPDWMRYMPRSFTSTWKTSPGFVNPSAQDIVDGNNDLRTNIEIVAAMRRAGLKLMTGTDANGPFPSLIPGISLHEELRLFVEAGYTPAEALRAATLAPAQFLARDKDFGTVERGKVADLVLLDADPLSDIRNTQKIQAVVLNGKVVDRKALDEMLSRLEAAAPNQ
jgi:hypothetical protein